MSWRDNSFNFWKSRQTKRNTQRYKLSVALLLFINMIIAIGCADNGAALNELKDELVIIDEGKAGTMKSEQEDKRDTMPVIDQNIPGNLETATFALG